MTEAYPVTDIDIIVGAHIRERRMLKGVPVGSLGDAIGVTVEQMRAVERGAVRASAQQVAVIAETLEASVQDLFRPLVVPFLPESDGDREDHRLLAAFRSIERPETRRLILSFVEGASFAEAVKLRSEPGGSAEST